MILFFNFEVKVQKLIALVFFRQMYFDPLIKYLTVIVCACLLLISCKKENEDVFPVVTFFQPVNNAPYDIFDTIAIRLRVDYPKPEMLLRINLQDEALVPVVTSLVIEDFETGVEADLYYVIGNEQLPSGNYSLVAEARDDEIYTRGYRQVFIHEIERTLKNIFLVEKKSDNQHAIHRYDQNHNLQQSVSYQGDYAGSDVSSASGQFFITGKYTGDLTAYDSDQLSVNWSSPNGSGGVQPYFSCLQLFDNMLFTGYHEGFIGRWSLTGQRGASTEVTHNTFARRLFTTDKYLIADAQERGNYLLHWLEVFYLDAGSLVATAQSDIRPLVFTEPEPGIVLMIGNNQSGLAYARLLHPATGLLGLPYQPFDFPASAITAAEAITPQRILLALENGIYIYDYKLAMFEVVAVQNVHGIRYEDISRTIWCLSENRVLVYDLSGELLSEHTPGWQLINFHLMYNK
jgi:hypothetical protein